MKIRVEQLYGNNANTFCGPTHLRLGRNRTGFQKVLYSTSYSGRKYGKYSI